MGGDERAVLGHVPLHVGAEARADLFDLPGPLLGRPPRLQGLHLLTEARTAHPQCGLEAQQQPSEQGLALRHDLQAGDLHLVLPDHVAEQCVDVVGQPAVRHVRLREDVRVHRRRLEAGEDGLQRCGAGEAEAEGAAQCVYASSSLSGRPVVLPLDARLRLAILDCDGSALYEEAVLDGLHGLVVALCRDLRVVDERIALVVVVVTTPPRPRHLHVLTAASATSSPPPPPPARRRTWTAAAGGEGGRGGA